MRNAIKLLVIIEFSFVLCIGYASAEVCKFDGKYETSVSQLVTEAQFIGRYKVLAATKDAESIYKKADSYQYNLILITDLKSGAENSLITITGRAPEKIPPQIYFAIVDQHSKIRPETPALFGISSMEKLKKGDHCRIAPSFVIGYEYLILGGVDTRISYEPIHSSDDAWYLMVKSTVETSKNPD